MISIKLCIPCPVCPQEALANGRLGCHGARRSQCLGPKGGTHRDTTLGTQVKIHSHLYGGFIHRFLVISLLLYYSMEIHWSSYIYMERIGTPLEWGFHTRRRSNMWVHWPFDPSPCALETGFDHIQAPWSISQHLPEKQKNINPSHLGFLYGVHISHDGSMVLVY